MRLRISGTRAECDAAVAAVLAVREVSGFFPNRGASVLGRVYLDADPHVGEVGSGDESTPVSNPGPAVNAGHSTRRAGASNPTNT